MKTFERDYKINFVDENNVLVGFDNSRTCCEEFGYFLSLKIPTNINDGQQVINAYADGFNFDVRFFQEVKPDNCLLSK